MTCVCEKERKRGDRQGQLDRKRQRERASERERKRETSRQRERAREHLHVCKCVFENEVVCKNGVLLSDLWTSKFP